MNDASQTPAHVRWWSYVIALAPLVPLLAALVSHLPPEDERIVPLTGTWQRQGGAAGAVALPGRLRVDGDPATFTRSVVLSGDVHKLDERYGIVFGGGQQLVIEMFVNGQRVGGEGVPEARFKHAALPLVFYDVEASLLRTGDNTIAMRVTPEAVGLNELAGIVEHRLYLGPASLLRPYFDGAAVLQSFFELGGAFYLLLAFVLVAAMARAETDPIDRSEQFWVALVALAVAGYLIGKSGFHNVLHIPRAIIPWSITVMGMAIPGFLQWHVLRRSSRLHRVNVFVCTLHLVAQQVLPDSPIYRLFIPYLFLAIVISLGVVAWDFAVRFPRRSPLLLVACLCLMIAGVNDLATDLGVVATPRLFSLAAADMAIMTTVVIAARFLRSLRENTALLKTLEEKNVALVAALDRAEETTRLKSAFLANTSHELRTPLNSIINVPEGLLEEFALRSFIVCSGCGAVFEASAEFQRSDATATTPCPECGEQKLTEETRWVFTGEPEAAVRYLKSIQASGRHLLAVVDDILDFSKLEAGRMTIRHAPARVSEILKKLDLTIRPIAEQRDITLVISPPADDVSFETDALKVVQVLMNLASNALKFTEDGTRVDVRASTTEHHVRFEVEDRGIGIAPADVDKVFESFRQLDSGHTRKFSGTGLGLPIAKNIVGLMGGTLDVKSVLGEGSTFTVTLPRARPAG